MGELPTFFFSHARQDREMPGNYLRRFFDDLEYRLAQYAGVSLAERRERGERGLGTLDARVRQGEDWDGELTRGLRNDKAFVAILTPLYFNRLNCGKELAVFLLRSQDLGIDQNGMLTGVRNLMPIRWLPEIAYNANAGKDSLVPLILRRVEDTPGDDGGDSNRRQAIERYRKKGMENCVKPGTQYYKELLALFVARIREMPTLPAASDVSFATAIDAFNYNWLSHFRSAGAPISSPPTTPVPVVPVVPRALASIVAFHITRRLFTPDPTTVDFADQLVTEALPDMPAPPDPVFNALLTDVRAAGTVEGFSVFHAAAKPVLPVKAESFVVRLASLSRRGVLTALVVDPTVWPGTTADAEAAAVEQIIRSPDWTGPVLLASLGASAFNTDDLVARRDLPPRLVALPQASEARVAELRRAFVDARGRVLRTSADQAPGAERPPVLQSVGAERS